MPRPGGVHRVEDDGGRVARLLGDHRDAVALAPDGQLLAGGGAEGVAGGEQHRFALRLEVLGQLADGGGLARAVHAGDHDDEGLVGGDLERLLQRPEQLEQDLAQRPLQLFAGLQLVTLDGGLQFVEEVLRRLDADVGHQQGGLQLLQHFVVDAPAEQAAELGAGARQAGLEALGPGGAGAAVSGVSDFFRKPNMGGIVSIGAGTIPVRECREILSEANKTP
jgi:hypothetical protein